MTLNLKGAYNLIKIKEENKWKTIFRIKRGLYKYLVILFSLINIPAIF